MKAGDCNRDSAFSCGSRSFVSYVPGRFPQPPNHQPMKSIFLSDCRTPRNAPRGHSR